MMFEFFPPPPRQITFLWRLTLLLVAVFFAVTSADLFAFCLVNDEEGGISSSAKIELLPDVPSGLFLQKDVWGDAVNENVQAVLQSVFNVFSNIYGSEYILRKNKSTIIKRASLPRTLTDLSAIHLETKDRFWCQYMYQFAHELYHYTCGDPAEYVRHQWFEEMIAEMHSLYVLDAVADKWETDPPYPNWSSFTPSIREYYDNAVRNDDIGMNDRELARFFKENRVILEKKPYIQFHKTTKVLDERADDESIRLASAFSPILYKEVFKKDNNAWEALKVVHEMGRCEDLSFEEFINEWHSRCDDTRKGAVYKIANMMEVELK